MPANASFSSAPPGFTYNPDYGDYENPDTGEWWDPSSGQIYANDAPPTDGPAAQGGPGAGQAGGAGGALATAYLANKALTGATAAAAPAAASSAAAAPAAAGTSATETALGIGGAAPGATAGGATTFATAEAASSAGYTVVGQTATGEVIAVPAAAGASPFLAAAGVPAGLYTGYKQYQGIKDIASGKKPGLISSAALLPFDGGASLGAKLAEKVGLKVPFGHSKNYYAGKDRSAMLDALSDGTGNIGFTTPDGRRLEVTSNSFRKDPNTYNYDLNSDSGEFDTGTANGLTYLLTGEKPGSKKFTDVAGMYANLHKQGVSADELFREYGLDYDTAMQAIGSDEKLNNDEKVFLQTGLNMGFGKAGYDKKGQTKNQPAKPAVAASTPAPAASTTDIKMITKDPNRKTVAAPPMIPRANTWDQVRSKISGQKPVANNFGKIPVFR